MSDSQEEGKTSDTQTPSDSHSYDGEDRRQSNGPGEGRRHDQGRRGTGRRRSLGES
jgi:hypothetical protein